MAATTWWWAGSGAMTCAAALSTTGPPVATGTILNDDIPPALAFRSLDAGSTTEGTAGVSPRGRLAFTPDRSGDLSFATSVVFDLGGTASLDDIASVSATNGGSVTPFPFGAGRYILTFDPGAASAGIEPFLAADLVPEPDETFTLSLASATAGAVDTTPIVFTILDDDANPPPPSGARFYVSGSTPGAGRELWLYDTNSDPSAPFATMVEGAEWLAGPQPSNPREIMGLSGTVFFRADEDGTPTWLAWTGSTLIALGAVGTEVFDAGLPLAEQNLGVISGDLVWLAI